MLIKVKRGFRLEGGVNAEPGSVIDVPDRIAISAITTQKAERVTAEEVKAQQEPPRRRRGRPPKVDPVE